MPTDIQAMLDQAFEAGRAAEREMTRISALSVEQVLIPSSKTSDRAPKAAAAPKGKAAGVARGVRKKASGPRTKGVKEAIIKMIGGREYGTTITDVINQLGFKERSIRATLYELKKTERAHNVGNLWYVSAQAKIEAANPLT